MEEVCIPQKEVRALLPKEGKGKQKNTHKKKQRLDRQKITDVYNK